MRKMSIALISLIGIALTHTAAIAQEYEGCFLIDRKGNVIKLRDLCPDDSQEVVPTNTSGVFEVPIKRRDAGIPVIDVTFNGNKTFEMMVDSGASITKVTQEMARAMGLKPDGTIKSQIASGDIIESPTARVASIAVGGAVSRDLMVSIGSVALLGQNFVGNYEMTIKKEAIEFRPHSSTASSQN